MRLEAALRAGAGRRGGAPRAARRQRLGVRLLAAASGAARCWASASCTPAPGAARPGKIERFFRTVRSQFLVELEARGGAADLAELNRAVRRLGGGRLSPPRPLRDRRGAAGAADAGRPAALPTPAELHEAFLWAEVRTVTKTASVSICTATTSRSTPALVGSKVELLFDPFDLDRHRGPLPGPPDGSRRPAPHRPPRPPQGPSRGGATTASRRASTTSAWWRPAGANDKPGAPGDGSPMPTSPTPTPTPAASRRPTTSMTSAPRRSSGERGPPLFALRVHPHSLRPGPRPRRRCFVPPATPRRSPGSAGAWKNGAWPPSPGRSAAARRWRCGRRWPAWSRHDIKSSTSPTPTVGGRGILAMVVAALGGNPHFYRASLIPQAPPPSPPPRRERGRRVLVGDRRGPSARPRPARRRPHADQRGAWTVAPRSASC